MRILEQISLTWASDSITSACLILLALLSFGGPAAAETVFLTPKEALKVFFQNSEQVVSEKKEITGDLKGKIEKSLGYSLSREGVTFYLGKTKGHVDGYALIDNEIGKTEPITFMTVMTPQGEVRAVEILVYRESHGGEVKSKRFLKQFESKKQRDPIRVGQDIDNISGATLSARALAKGVKRGVTFWKAFYGGGL